MTTVRLYRAMKWAATLGCVLVVMALLVGMIWDIVVVRLGFWSFAIARSELLYNWVADEARFGIECENIGVGLRAELWLLQNIGYSRTVPLWMPLVALAVPTALLWYFDSRVVAIGVCRQCGYDLTGNVSGRCPECGRRTRVGVTP